MVSSRNTGIKGEELAISYLEKKKHQILHRNFKSVYGEIDIISMLNGNIYIYEVKYRKSNKYGYGDLSINASKIEKIKKTFDVWLSENADYANCGFFLNALVIDPNGTINEFEIL